VDLKKNKEYINVMPNWVLTNYEQKEIYLGDA